MTPRLTIGIPTHCRPETLPRAVLSCLRQTVSVQIIVGHDGNDTATVAKLQERFPGELDDGRVRYVRTGAKCLWENWAATARLCSTEFFLWLQDDDVLLPNVAARVAAAFDQFPKADLWLACNKIALDDRHHWWNNGNGPWVPLRADGGIDEWECEILRPTCYFLSWSLSPAVAFRVGSNFRAVSNGHVRSNFGASLDAMPADCAIFAERLILTGMTGRFVADPCVAGLWIQHEDNEHRKLHDDQPRQTVTLIDRLDRLMDATPEWEKLLALWCKLQHPHWIAGWIGDFEHAEREGGKSRYGAAIRAVMVRSLDGRVKYVPVYKWWRRAFNRLIGKAAL